ncbi:uncharacterized protein LOC141649171 [Silene latifolia]|uniref:uncharacterized protein LOC141649171 n=1 Tax=Silene latifolia TaxID=37657 RepID=UPI003D7789E6
MVIQESKKFRFHPLCQRIKLNHLCFADDLVMFCKGERKSIELMLNAFNYFSKASGLTMNKGKSNFYCNGVDAQLIDEVVNLTGMKKGTVSFKYLGVNVSLKRLSVQDYTCLVDKVVDMIRGLRARKLSYAGRVVLIQSVLSSLHSYWSRIFIIPKTVTRKIEAICRTFLWHGSDNKDSPSLVKNILKGLIFDSMGDPVATPYSSSNGYSLLVLDMEQDRLVRMHIIQHNRCFLCGAMAEDHYHLFFQCTYSHKCLGLVSDWCKTRLPEHDWVAWWINWRQRFASRKQVIAMILSCLAYHIWQMRNKCRWEGVVSRPEYLVKLVKQEVGIRIDQIKFKCKNVNVLRWMDEVRMCKR